MPDDTLDLAELPVALESHHALLPEPEAAVTEAVAALRNACERSHLAVLGPEGAGKSTLVNALVGAEVAPVSEGVPGTVAPVHVTYGSGPRYRVLRRAGGQGPGRPGIEEEISDLADFEHWMLQEHNPHNESEVLRGEIELPAPLLRDGLRLVDMPGIAGVSDQVAAQTANDLDGHAFSVVLVSMGRVSLKGLVDIVRDLSTGSRPARVAAVVFNEFDRRPLTPERLRERLTMRRRSVTELLLPLDEDGSLGLAQASVHCLCLADPEQILLERLRARLLERIRRDVGDTVAVTAQYAFPVLDAALARRETRVLDVLAGRIGRDEIRRHQDEVLGGVDRGRGEQGDRRRGEPAEPDALDRIELATRVAEWRNVEQAFLTEVQRITVFLDTVKARIFQPSTISKSVADGVTVEIQEMLDTSSRRLAVASEPGLVRLAAELEAYVGEREARFDHQVPTGLHRRAGRVASTTPLEAGRYQYRSAGDGWRQFVSQDNSEIVNMAATIVFPVVHYAAGGHRGHTLNRINSLRRNVSSALAGTPQTPAERWADQRTALVAEARACVLERIESLGDMAAGRQAPMTSALRGHLNRLDGARKDLADRGRTVRPKSGAR
ncbi:dynamin family protein [Streptomyces sp. NPDC017949]|uniref:dynamin family protein n=1 Tax=Streptomyces sp. NPDC017949 TaxID=3365020 RepID=UPI0037995AD6